MRFRAVVVRCVMHAAAMRCVMHAAAMRCVGHGGRGMAGEAWRDLTLQEVCEAARNGLGVEAAVCLSDSEQRRGWESPVQRQQQPHEPIRLAAPKCTMG